MQGAAPGEEDSNHNYKMGAKRLAANSAENNLGGLVDHRLCKRLQGDAAAKVNASLDSTSRSIRCQAQGDNVTLLSAGCYSL